MNNKNTFNWFFMEFLKTQGITLNKLVKLCNEKYKTDYCYANLGRKIKRGSITFNEVEKLVNTLNFDIKFIKRL